MTSSVTEKLLRKGLEICSPTWEPHCWKDADVLMGFIQEQEETKREDRLLLEAQTMEPDLAEQELERNTDSKWVMVWLFKAVQCAAVHRKESHNWMPGKITWNIAWKNKLKKFRGFPTPLKT